VPPPGWLGMALPLEQSASGFAEMLYAIGMGDGRRQLEFIEPAPVRPRRSRVARWRILSLVLVNVLIVAHIVQWRLTGRTVGPVILSDAAYTLELGEINPGFVLFAVVLLVTLVAGRFLCGWACHMGALQEFCAWVLKRLGFRPRPFRARLLGYVPLGLAVYMFVWPSFRREVLAPALAQWWPEGLAYIGVTAAFPGFTPNLVTHDMWERLPSVAVTIPFLLICGAATVYFLGSRGLCRYGCPYGGVLRIVERFSPGRVVVDMAGCDQCGHCTAACSAGVRVHEEVRAYGRVVSADCIRSLDCISVCPQRALSFRATRPGILRGQPEGRRPMQIYDLTWLEELAVLALFLGAFSVLRGIYGVVPMLMAVAMAICIVPLVLAMGRMVSRHHVRFASAQAKRDGRITRAGWAVAGVGVVVVALLAHSAWVRALQWRGDLFDRRVLVPAELVFAGRFDQVPEQAAADAARALELYARAGSWQRGGIGLTDTPRIDERMAWLHMVLRELEAAEAALRRVERREGLGDGLTADLARLMLAAGREDRAVAHLTESLERSPGLRESRDMLAGLLRKRGRNIAAEDLYRRALMHNPRDAAARAVLAYGRLQAGQIEAGVREFRQAAGDAPRDAGILSGLALAEYYTGDVDAALLALERAARVNPQGAAAYFRQGAEMLSRSGREEEARRWVERGK
jgi:polyferredoxin/tetratricopeptide (TPR) repeat protein